MDGLTGLCFGGPLNGELRASQYTPMLVAIPHKLSYIARETPDPSEMTVPYRTERYDWMRFGAGEWVEGCWVYDGFPIDRIEYGLRVSAFLGGLWSRV